MYDRELVAGKLRRWETYLLRFQLPAWEMIPNMGLYMEQVVDLLREYLDYMPPELKEEQEIITAAAINNYVRRGLLPAPVKKRYYRAHIAVLLMICTLKQSLSLDLLRALLPQGDESAVRAAYEAYAARHDLSAKYFVEQVRLAGAQLLGHEQVTPVSVPSAEELIAGSAIVAGFARLLAEKLLLLARQAEAAPAQEEH